MADSLKKDPKALRACILYEFLKGHQSSAYEMYKTLCQTIGNDSIEYPEFDFWFYRFSEGKFDLDYDRNLDPKPPLLTDLPIEIIEDIVKKSKWTEKMHLQKVSRVFRGMVNRQDPGFKTITVQFTKKNITLFFDNLRFIYTLMSNGSKVRNGRKWKMCNGESYIDQAFNDLVNVFKMPMLQLEKLEIDFDWGYEEEDDSIERETTLMRIKNILDQLNRKIHVKCVEMKVKSQEEVIPILPFLLPGVLEEIKLERSEPLPFFWSEIKMQQIVQLDQWNQSKRFNMIGLVAIRANINKFSHFNCFNACLKATSTKDMVHFKNTLLNSSNFQSCYVEIHEFNSSAIEKKACGKWPMPGNTNKVLDIGIDEYGFGINCKIT